MPYKPPSYAFLKSKTKHLQQSFAQLTERYTSPPYDTLRERLLNLKNSYTQKLKEKNKKRWLACSVDRTRLEQIGCITQLTGNMPASQSVRNQDELEMAKSILIGSCLYRYVRITGSYQGAFGFFGSAEDDSALHMALYEVLGLSSENKLDPLTWVSCCSAYRDYLLKNDNYTSYSYIDNDADFFINLDSIISKEQKKAQVMIKPLQYLVFIQSMFNMIDIYLTELMALSSQVKSLLNNKKAKEGTTVKKLDFLELLATLNPKNDLYELYTMILPDNYKLYVNSSGQWYEKHSEKAFEEDIEQRITIYSHYALLAAYILVLTKINKPQNTTQVTAFSIQEQELLKTLEKALKDAVCAYESNQLDLETSELALTSLQVFMVPDENLTKVNTAVWGGIDLLKAELHRQLVDIRSSLPVSSEAVLTL